MTSARPTPPSTGLPRRTLDKRARIALPLCGALLLGLAIHRLIIADPAERPYFEFTGRTMGTTYSVKVATQDLSEAAKSVLARDVEAQLDRVNALMSSYLPDSELSRFNRHRATDPFEFSEETIEIFRIARRVSEMTGGAFDITVGPLVAAWGFGATDRPPEPPSEEARRELQQRVGYTKLIYDPARPTVAKSDPRIECDLSAIAKGYGVDLVARTIEKLGHSNYLVEIGGELRAHGHKLDGRIWRVGIERPDAAAPTSHEVVVLSDISLATSGDYRDYYEVEGQRISHTIDPRAGRPIAHHLASVSVLHAEAVWADALATALNVMGPEDGLAWAEAHKTPALFLVREDGGKFRTIASTAFARLREPQ
ncbi:MAG: FAD:protein FMN transferase [Myxococcales bacterium]|nr:FAD:protein FMN transferase [Myxococcales bacterium]